MNSSNQDVHPSTAPLRSELGTHWRVLAGCFLGIGAGGASLFFYSSGLMLKPVAAMFEVNRATASLAPLLGGLIMGLSTPLMGWLSERWGTLRVALCAYICMGIGFCLLGTVTHDFTTFLVITCLLGLACGGTTPGVLTRPVVLAFRRQRGIALGMAVTGTGVGAVAMPMLLVRVIEAYGWQGGYLAIAGLLALLSPFALWFLRHSPEQPLRKAKPASSPAPVSRSVNWFDSVLLRMVLVFLLVSLAALGSVVHVVPMITDRGLTGEVAGRYAAVLGASIIGCRLLTGWLLDRFEAAGLTTVLFTAAASGMLLLASHEPALLMPGLLLLGLSVGSEHDLAAYLVGRYFPERYALVFGVMYAVTGLGASFGPLIAAHAFDATGSYRLWFWSSMVMMLLAAAIAWTLRGAHRDRQGVDLIGASPEPTQI